MTEDKKVTQRRRLSARARLLLITAAILLLLPCLGLGGGFAYLRVRKTGVLTRWRSLGAAPGGGVEILTADIGVVYVAAGTGKAYGCKHRGRTADRDCWHEAQEPLIVDDDTKFDVRLFEGEVVAPSGTVLDSLDVTIWRAEDVFETRYVLLEDGTVWKWEYDVGSYWSFTLLVLGLAAGLVVAVVVVVVMWARAGMGAWRRRRNSMRGPGEDV